MNAMNPTSYSRDLTGADLSSHMGPVGAKSGLNVGFFWTQVRLRTTDPEKNGQVVNRLCVAKQPKGDPKTLVHRYISPEEAGRQFPQEYALFVQYEDVPASGTPLSELPGISRSQMLQLELYGLRCVEDLQHIDESQANQYGMEISRARRVAINWLKKREDEKDVISASDVEAKAQAAIDAMTKRLERLEQHNLQLQAERDAAYKAGGNGGGGARAAAEAMPAAPEDNVPYEIDDSDDFMAGGDVATGGDDLGEDDPDPLKE